MKKKILVSGPCFSQSGYGEQTRFALKAFRSREDLFDIYVQPRPWGNTGWIWEDNEFRHWVDKRVTQTVIAIQDKSLHPDVSLQITIPNEWSKMAPVNVGYTAGIETTKVSPQWLPKGNEMDKIIVVSTHSKNVYQNTVAMATNQTTGEQGPYKLNTEIEVVNFGVKDTEPEPIENLNLDFDFNFLFISQWSPRKNMENTIQWWIEEFIDQEVGLVVKTNMANNSIIDRHHTTKRIKNLLEKYPDRKCKVFLLHGDLSDGQMKALYQHSKIKALINLAHGEGFGLPMFEAASNGLPIIAIPWSGHLDYLNYNGKNMFQEVGFTMQPIQQEAIWPGVIEGDSMWAFADQGSYKMTLRKVYKKWDLAKKTADELKEIINHDFDEKAMYKKFISHFYESDGSEDISIDQIPKISLVTSLYRAEDYIEQLMEDVTRQTIFEEKCEWIILNVNPEGYDAEEEIILKYMEKYPNNIVYKRLEEDPGIYDTWNMAIQMSTGDFVTNVNCDDRRPPWAYEKQAKLLVASEDVDLVYNDSYVTHEPNIMWEDIKEGAQRYNFEQFSKEAMLRSNLPHNNPMWRKEVHDKHGYFNQYYKSAGDWDFWLRCAFGGSKFKKASEVLGVYYFNPTGMSTNPEHDSWKKEHEREIFQNYLQVLQQG